MTYDEMMQQGTDWDKRYEKGDTMTKMYHVEIGIQNGPDDWEFSEDESFGETEDLVKARCHAKWVMALNASRYGDDGVVRVCDEDGVEVWANC